MEEGVLKEIESERREALNKLSTEDLERQLRHLKSKLGIVIIDDNDWDCEGGGDEYYFEAHPEFDFHLIPVILKEREGV